MRGAEITAREGAGRGAVGEAKRRGGRERGGVAMRQGVRSAESGVVERYARAQRTLDGGRGAVESEICDGVARARGRRERGAASVDRFR